MIIGVMAMGKRLTSGEGFYLSGQMNFPIALLVGQAITEDGQNRNRIIDGWQNDE